MLRISTLVKEPHFTSVSSQSNTTPGQTPLAVCETDVVRHVINVACYCNDTINQTKAYDTIAYI